MCGRQHRSSFSFKPENLLSFDRSEQIYQRSVSLSVDQRHISNCLGLGGVSLEHFSFPPSATSIQLLNACGGRYSIGRDGKKSHP